MLATQSHLDAALIVFVLSVALIDWGTHRIPNLLCATAAVLGLVSQMWLHGEAGLLVALGGAAVGFSMFLPFYAVRAFGAGDVKAMTTVGIFIGWKITLLAVGLTLIAGAVIGIFVLMLSPVRPNVAIQRVIGLLATPASMLRRSEQQPALPSSQRFPYGVAIACGTAAALFASGRLS